MGKAYRAQLAKVGSCAEDLLKTSARVNVHSRTCKLRKSGSDRAPWPTPQQP